MSRLLLVPLAVLALLLGACGSDDPSPSSSTSSAGGAAEPAEEAAFPATVEHKYGTTTVESKPERVVVAGLREQDAVLALGTVPVATTEWFGGHEGAIFPWAEEALGSAPAPTVLTTSDGLEVERIASLRPDLIVAIYSDLKKKDYETLSKLAPTIAPPEGVLDYGASWQQDTLMVGQALGKPKAAQALVDQREAEIAKVREAHPEFDGKSAAIATPYQGYWVYGAQDGRVRLLSELGLGFPQGLKSIGGGKTFGGTLSAERLELLDVDAVLWFANPGPAAKVRKDPVYSRLDVRKEGRDVFLTEKGELYDATNVVSVLSLPIVLEQLVPKLAAAVDGDPATDPAEAA